MTTPQRQTISNQLLERLQPYIDSDAPLSEFDRRSFARETAKLEQVNPAEAANVRAIQAAIEWQPVEIERQVAELLRRDVSVDSLAAASYPFTLINDFDRAHELALQAWKLAPANQTSRVAVVSLLLQSGRLGEALSFVESQNQSMEPYVVHSPAQTARLVATFAELGVLPDRVRSEIRVGMQVMAERRIRLRSSDFARLRDAEEGTVSVLALLRFQGDIAAEIELSEALAGRLMDSPDWDPAVFTVKFDSLTMRNAQLAA